MDDQRDYDEEAANRAEMVAEGEAELAEETRTEIAWMIADWFGRSAIDSDHELAANIIKRLQS